MENLSATINFADEHLPVLLTPALKTMGDGPLKARTELIHVNLAALIESHLLEPALYHNPYFVLPRPDQQDSYLRFLQALRYTDKYALANIGGWSEQCLLYPYNDYLLLVLITATEALREPDAPEWTTAIAAIAEKEVAPMRAKLENLDRNGSKTRSATT